MAMYLLDTDVVSELRRMKPHGAVLAWIRTVDDADLHISAVTLGEIQKGIEKTRVHDSAKASEIEAWLVQVAGAYNVLAMDGRAFRRWGQLMHRQQDHLIEDAMIAATALVHGLTVMTRNAKYFEGFGVVVFNPWGKI
jgi:toxin FitB